MWENYFLFAYFARARKTIKKRERRENSERRINEGKILRSLFVVVSFCLFSTGPIQIRKTTRMRHSFYFSHRRENRPQETHSIVIGYKGVECVCQRHDYFPHQKKKEFCSLLLRKLNECVQFFFASPFICSNNTIQSVLLNFYSKVWC